MLKVSIGKIGRRKQYDEYQAKKLGVPNLIALDLVVLIIIIELRCKAYV